MKRRRDHSSAGRASALQAGGHRFEPYCSHHSGPVAQLVRAPACHAGGRGFEPHPGRHLIKIQPLLYASVAQLVEQGTENPRVVGSIPTGGTTFADLAHLVERNLAKVNVASSNLVSRSINRRYSQAVRPRSAKPLCPGSNPGGASKKIQLL